MFCGLFVQERQARGCPGGDPVGPPRRREGGPAVLRGGAEKRPHAVRVERGAWRAQPCCASRSARFTAAGRRPSLPHGLRAVGTLLGGRMTLLSKAGVACSFGTAVLVIRSPCGPWHLRFRVARRWWWWYAWSRLVYQLLPVCGLYVY